MATAPRTQTRAVIAELVQSTTLPVLLILAAMVIGIAALLPLVQSSGATTTAGNIQALEQEKTSWQAQLRELETQVATLGSLNRIEAEARDRLGMEPPQVTHYITVDVPPPESQKLPSRFLPNEHPKPQSESSLWKDLFGWMLP